MKKNFSTQDRLQASRDSVKGNGSWLWLIAAFASGLILSVPLFYILCRNHIDQIARASLFKLGGALGLAENAFFQKLGIGPSPLELRFAKLVFEEHEAALWCVLIAQVAGMVVYLLFFSGKNGRKNTHHKLRADERDAVTVRALSREIALAPKTIGLEFKPHPHDFLLSGLKGLRIPERSLASMLGIVGGAGQGKTNVLRQFVASRREAGGKCILVDVNGEYASIFSRPGDVILSLHDNRAIKWNLWAEDIPIEDIAECMLEVGETSHSTSSGEFFSTASHAVLVALLRSVKSEDELWRVINMPRDSLADKIRSLPGIAKHMLGASNDAQTAGVLASAVRKLAFFEHVNQFSKSREHNSGKHEDSFSVSEWVKNNDDKRWVFLVATDATLNQTRTLFRIWISILAKSLMARSESASNERIYLVCDELASVGKIPRLSDFLTAVRRKNGRAVLGFQSISQLEHIYGQIDTRTILQGLQNLIVFRCADPSMSKLMAERIGKLEVVEHAFSQSRDQKTHNYVPQVSERVRDKWIVSPNTISNLGIGEAILCMAQFSPCQVKFKKVNFPSHSPTAEHFVRLPKASLLQEISEESMSPTVAQPKNETPQVPAGVVKASSVSAADLNQGM